MIRHQERIAKIERGIDPTLIAEVTTMILRHQERIAKIERGIDPDAGTPRS